jgi:hypothetical protein
VHSSQLGKQMWATMATCTCLWILLRWQNVAFWWFIIKIISTTIIHHFKFGFTIPFSPAKTSRSTTPVDFAESIHIYCSPGTIERNLIAITRWIHPCIACDFWWQTTSLKSSRLAYSLPKPLERSPGLSGLSTLQENWTRWGKAWIRLRFPYAFIFVVWNIVLYEVGERYSTT